jgi:2-polyprenyl-3-methyl-5-hydroxy-6-metoxy-1,4-benzoquinol methylase
VRILTLRRDRWSTNIGCPVALETTRVSACPGCGCTQASPEEMDVRDAKYGVPGAWLFLRCAQCGLVYLATPLADPAQGYPTAYTQHRPPGRVRPDRRWSLARDVRNTLLRRRGYRELPPVRIPRRLAGLALALPNVRVRAAYGTLLLPPARAGGTLLDVGCGNGRFLGVMRLLGWRVHGIEPDARSAEIARRASGARVDAQLDAGLYQPAFFDVITMNHVLEHIPDPVAALETCLALCRPGGRIGIVVPNWRALGHRIFRRDWYALEPPRHVVMYEPATLGRALEHAGFRVDSVATTSVREWRTAWRRSWAFRTGRRSPRPLLGAWGVLTLLASGLLADAGEEIVAWAHRPMASG